MCLALARDQSSAPYAAVPNRLGTWQTNNASAVTGKCSEKLVPSLTESEAKALLPRRVAVNGHRSGAYVLTIPRRAGAGDTALCPPVGRFYVKPLKAS